MLSAYEQHLLASYLFNAATSLHHQDTEALELADWVANKAKRIARARNRRRFRRHRADEDRDGGMSAKKLRSLQETLQMALAASGKPRGDRGARRLRRLGKTLGLTRTDLDILELLLRYETHPLIESLVDDVFECGLSRPNALNVDGLAMPMLLGVTATTIHRRLRNDAPLVRSGLVSIDEDGDPTVVGRLNRLFTTPGDASVDVHRLLLDAAPPSTLEWSDFDHVAEGRDHIARLLEGALRTSAAGVNIILYGPPGTGKTALCRTLADQMDTTLYSVGESDDSGNEPTRSERLQELRLAQRLLAGNRGSLLLFDEMEDL
ncbi:MAG: ATP-binding protein, partial [Chloroflexi bacterium]|nr:ATP-binding protein [Chloroflexota bacterium]